MLRASSSRALRYLNGTRATAGGSVASLLDGYQTLDANVKAATRVPSSQRYFYEKTARASHQHRRSNGNNNNGDEGVFAHDELSQRHTTIQLRLGAAQLLTSTTQRCIANDNAVHPLYFAHTSPRLAGLCMPLVTALKRLGIAQLTELQGALVPLLLRGKHVIAHAETGSGKSFAIALAIANRILRDNINYRLHTIVLVPTDELALQYDKWLRYFCGSTGQICQVAIDRIPRELQLARLHNMLPHVLVGTPQRIADVAQLSRTLLGEKLRRKVDCLVLDEADLILSASLHDAHTTRATRACHMTGVNLVERLFRHQRDEVPAQLVAASATIDGHTARQLNTWTRNDKTVRLTTSFVEHTIPRSISFYFFAATSTHPLPRCLELALRVICRQTRRPRILIFTAEDDVARVVQLLQCELQPRVREAHAWLRGDSGDNGSEPARVFAAALQRTDASSHNDDNDDDDDDVTLPQGQKQQPQQRRHAARGQSATAASSRPQYVRARGHVYVKDSSTLSQLNAGTLLIGVAGHTLSRGLHIHDVTHVILYGDCPTSTAFAHCVGRTGRMGSEGDVLVLFTPASGRAVQQACHAFEIPFVAGKLSQLTSLLDEDNDDNDKHDDGGYDDDSGSGRDGDDACSDSDSDDEEDSAHAPPYAFGTAASLDALDATNAAHEQAMSVTQLDADTMLCTR